MVQNTPEILLGSWNRAKLARCTPEFSVNLIDWACLFCLLASNWLSLTDCLSIDVWPLVFDTEKIGLSPKLPSFEVWTQLGFSNSCQYFITRVQSRIQPWKEERLTGARLSAFQPDAAALPLQEDRATPFGLWLHPARSTILCHAHAWIRFALDMQRLDARKERHTTSKKTAPERTAFVPARPLVSRARPVAGESFRLACSLNPLPCPVLHDMADVRGFTASRGWLWRSAIRTRPLFLIHRCR